MTNFGTWLEIAFSHGYQVLAYCFFLQSGLGIVFREIISECYEILVFSYRFDLKRVIMSFMNKILLVFKVFCYSCGELPPYLF
jgi:hypothetical protein